MRDIGYQIGRVVGTPLFKNYYNPTIIGEENIPKDGPILLCGNHLHVLDQFPVIVSTKRTSHWMAKKEYFDGKLGPLFKLTGAICVDRYGDSNKSFDEAINYLENGDAVGLFPEGTRNGLKEEKLLEMYNFNKEDYKNISFDEFKSLVPKDTLASQIRLLDELYKDNRISKEEYRNYILSAKTSLLKLNKNGVISDYEYSDSILLPFKYGAVAMAQKINAKIVPFAVTGKYQKHSDDLMVRFGEPFNVLKDANLSDANYTLRDDIKKLVYKNLK